MTFLDHSSGLIQSARFSQHCQRAQHWKGGGVRQLLMQYGRSFLFFPSNLIFKSCVIVLYNLGYISMCDILLVICTLDCLLKINSDSGSISLETQGTLNKCTVKSMRGERIGCLSSCWFLSPTLLCWSSISVVLMSCKVKSFYVVWSALLPCLSFEYFLAD